VNDNKNARINGKTFKPYSSNDKGRCLALFDSNCPEYFAPNERVDYENFLNSNSAGYELCIDNKEIVGAFGLFKEDTNQSRLDWILLNPKAQGIGIDLHPGPGCTVL
jgi:hypothetical protein